MFYLTWTTFKFERNQLGTVSAYVMSSVPWINVSIKSLAKNYSLKNSLWDKGPEVKWDQTAAQFSIIFPPIY